VNDEVTGLPAGGQGTRESNAETELGEQGRLRAQVGSDVLQVRAARAKLIEDTTYRLTDLFTVVSARIQILSDKVPTACRDELFAIRKVLLDCVELNRRLFQAAEACRREIGIQKNNDLEQQLRGT